MNQKSLLSVLLVISACMSVALCSCKDQNSYLKSFHSYDSSLVRSTKTTNATKCAGEWNVFGTCCNEAAMSNFIAADRRDLTDELGIMVAAFDSLYKDASSAVKDIREYLKNPVYALGAAAYTTQIQGFIDSVTKMESFKSRYQSDQAKCYSKLKDIRSRSICPICSGRSQLFFNDKNILMDETVCRAILVECDSAWNNLLHVVQANSDYDEFKSYESLAFPAVTRTRLFTELGVDLVGKNGATALSRLTTFAQKNQLEDYLKDCKEFATCPFSKAASLCQGFVEIVPTVKILKLTNSKMKEILRQTSSSFINPLSRMKKAIHKVMKTAESRKLFFKSPSPFGQSASTSKEASYLASPFGIDVTTKSTCATILGIVDTSKMCAPMDANY